MIEKSIIEKPRRSLFLTLLLVVMGCIFAGVWIYAHFVWAALSGMANLMANDSGRASMGSWMKLFGGMFTGQMIAASAGIPGGLAFFWRGRRKLLILAFGLLFLIGALLQISTFQSFFSNGMGQ